jgi:hypothetical protein
MFDKHKALNWILFVATFCLVSVPWTHGAESKTETVVDLFLRVPPETLGLVGEDGKLLPIATRPSIIKTTDIPNGWLELDGSKIERMPERWHAALFRRKGNTPILVFAGSREPGNDWILALTEKSGRWEDVTESVLPIPDAKWIDVRARERAVNATNKKKNLSDCASGRFFYELPRIGRVIRAKISSDCFEKDNGREIFQMEFNGTEFKRR